LRQYIRNQNQYLFEYKRAQQDVAKRKINEKADKLNVSSFVEVIEGDREFSMEIIKINMSRVENSQLMTYTKQKLRRKSDIFNFTSPYPSKTIISPIRKKECNRCQDI